MLKYYQHKTQYLSRHIKEATLTRLSLAIRNTLQEHQENHQQISEVFHNILELELCYCLVRHRGWHQSPIFFGMAVAFLCQEFRLPKETAESLVEVGMEGLLEEFQSLNPVKAIDDHDFLRLIFVSSATSLDESTLACDIGLGRQLIQKLKAALRGIQSEDDTQFLGEQGLSEDFELVFAQILAEFEDDLRLKPWIIDEHRLRFHLIKYSLDDTAKIFQHLLVMGQKSYVDESTFHALAQSLSVPADPSDLIQELSAKELIYSEPVGKKQEMMFHLAHLGHELTACAFAIQATQESFDVRTLPELSAAYQRAIIEVLEPHYDQDLLELTKMSGRRLAAPTLKVIVDRLYKSQAPEDLYKAILPLAKVASPWLRQSAVECLARFDIGMRKEVL